MMKINLLSISHHLHIKTKKENRNRSLFSITMLLFNVIFFYICLLEIDNHFIKKFKQKSILLSSNQPYNHRLSILEQTHCFLNFLKKINEQTNDVQFHSMKIKNQRIEISGYARSMIDFYHWVNWLGKLVSIKHVKQINQLAPVRFQIIINV